jgi:hypothetical protein
MGSVTYPYISTYLKGFSVLVGDHTGYLVLVENTAIAVNGTAALVVEFPPDSVPFRFLDNEIPMTVVRALDQLPRVNTLAVVNLSDKQRLTAICEGGIRVDFSIPPSGSKTLALATRLKKVADQPAVEEFGSRKPSEFTGGWQFGGFTFLKPVIKPVVEAIKIVHPLAPKATFVDADVTLAADLVAPKPVPILRLKFTGFGKVTALIVPATGN